LELALAEDRQPSGIAETRRPQVSAHEEHGQNGRTWCAICGWLDEITVPAAFAKLYHSNFAQSK
jgi:hypothetical protein